MRVVTMIVFLVFAIPVTSSDADRKLKCEEIKQDIRLIQSKMRAGYSRAQGEKLRAKLRKLRALRSKACR